MIRPLPARLTPSWWFLSAILLCVSFAVLEAAPPTSGPAKKVPGQFLPVLEPITSETIAEIRAKTRQLIDRSALKGEEPILVFEFRPGETAPGTSEGFASLELASYISRKIAGAKMTVAYVPEPLEGYAVLAVMACDEIVMGPQASLGPIAPGGQQANSDLREPIRNLAMRTGRDPDLLLGMLNREADLRAVRTANKQVHYVFAENLATFKTTNQVLEEGPAWKGGQRGVLTAQAARDEGFVKLTADSPVEVARYYDLAGQSMANNPILGQNVKPVWIKIDGVIDPVKKSYLSRRIEQARQERVNLVFFEIDSPGGIDSAADGVADLIAGIKDMKTVAYINDRAVGVSALVALACNEIVFHKDAMMGDVRQLVTSRGGQTQALDDRQIQTLARRAAGLAQQNGHPAAVARAMVDPEAAVVEATDSKTGARCFVLRTQVEAAPERYLNPEVRKEAGHVLEVSAKEAETYGLGQSVGDKEELKAFYGLRGKDIRVDGPTWVDSLVTVLTDPFVSWLLLFVGLFMLVLELKLPGIGLPAITSALAFLLFFWSHYLSGTADQLEIILFLVGLVCLALELFVFPRLRRLRDERGTPDPHEHRDGESHVRLAHAGVRISGDGLYAPPSDGRNGGGRRRGHRAGAILPLATALQPPDLEAGALDRHGRRRPDGEALARGIRVARVPGRRDRPYDHDAPAVGKGPLRRALDRRHRGRILHRARQPRRSGRGAGIARHRQASR